MPLTGRMHQLHAHCAAIGHPIVGDKKYAKQQGASGRLHLHAGVVFKLGGRLIILRQIVHSPNDACHMDILQRFPLFICAHACLVLG